MKPTFFIALLYLCLSLLVISCENYSPEPDYVVAEVMGADCDQNWYILKLEKSATSQTSSSACYAAPWQEDFVTTRNLPDEYRVPGKRVNVALQQEPGDSPRCLAINAMFPAVQIQHISSARSSN